MFLHCVIAKRRILRCNIFDSVKGNNIGKKRLLSVWLK